MTFTDNIAHILEVCKLKNLTVYKFIMELCVVLRSQLLSQVQVELEEYMQMCMVRAPFLTALKSDTVDDATFRVPVMGAVMAEWRVNRRVRQQTAKLQRELTKRQAEEQPVPCCSPAWIYQDFPSLLSETKAESLPISILCDLILKRYDLTKDKDFRDLYCEVKSELQKQQPDQVDRVTQSGSQTNQSLSTSCVPRENTEPNSLPMRADWFRHYQPAQSHTEVPLFGQSGLSTVAEVSARQHHKTTNYPRQHNKHDTKGHMSLFDSARGSQSIHPRTGPIVKTVGHSGRYVYNGPEVKRHNDQFGYSSCTDKVAPNQKAIVSSGLRKYEKPRVHQYKQTQGHVSMKRSDELKRKTNNLKKSFDQKIEDFLSNACPNTTKPEQTKTNLPEFSSAHMGGLVIKIAKRPKRVQVTEPKQPKNELTVKERKRQAFLAHVARIQKKLKKNLKADAQTNKQSSHKLKATGISVYTDAQTAHSNLDTSKADMVIEKDSSRKRKPTESSMCSSIQNKCARLDTSSDLRDSSRKRKAPNGSLCSSIQSKYARLDTGSAIKALKRHVIKRQH